MIDFFLQPAGVDAVWIVILLAGFVTFITRACGHLILAQFDNIHPRVEAALEAVPASVMVTLVLPQVVTKGPLEIAALLVALVASLRLSTMWVLLLGLAVVIAGRAAGF